MGNSIWIYKSHCYFTRFFFLLSKFECWNGKLENIIIIAEFEIGLQKCVRPIVQHLLSMRWKCSQLATLNVRVCHPQNIKQDNFFSHTNYSIRNEKVSECFSKDLGFSEKVKILPGRLNSCSKIAVSVCCDHVVPITTINSNTQSWLVAKSEQSTKLA